MIIDTRWSAHRTHIQKLVCLCSHVLDLTTLVTSEGFGKHLYSLENGDLKKFLGDCTSLILIHGQV